MAFQRFFLMLVGVALMASPALAEAVVGKAAPEFAATDTNGKPVSLAALKGKVVVLEWTNPFCPFVLKHYGSGNMQKTQGYAAGKDVVWVSINSAAEGKQGYMTDAEANAITTERKASPAHILRDPTGEIGRLYGAKTTPHVFVIDAEGTLAYMGAIDSEPTADPEDIKGAVNYVTAAIDAVVHGKTPAVPQTQPYGCAVKYGE